MFLYTITLAAPVAKKLFDVDLFEHAPGSKSLLEKLQEMPKAIIIEKDKRAANPAFKEYLAKAFAKR